MLGGGVADMQNMLVRISGHERVKNVSRQQRSKEKFLLSNNTQSKPLMFTVIMLTFGFILLFFFPYCTVS